MEWEGFFNSHQDIVRSLERGVDSNYYQLFVTGSYADVYPTLAFMKAYYEKIQTPISVLISSRWQLLANRFLYPFISYRFYEPHYEMYIRSSLQLQARPHVRRPGYLFCTLPTVHPYISDFVLSDRVTDLECRRLMLGLDVGTPLDHPPLSESRRSEINQLIANAGIIKNRSVIIAFETNSNDAPPESIQRCIDSEVRALKFVSLVNSAATSAAPPKGKNADGIGTKTIEIPCDAPCEIVEEAGFYIGAPHGLTVILSIFGTNAKLANVPAVATGSVLNNNRLIDARLLDMNHAFRGDVRTPTFQISPSDDLDSLKVRVRQFLGD